MTHQPQLPKLTTRFDSCRPLEELSSRTLGFWGLKSVHEQSALTQEGESHLWDEVAPTVRAACEISMSDWIRSSSRLRQHTVRTFVSLRHQSLRYVGCRSDTTTPETFVHVGVASMPLGASRRARCAFLCIKPRAREHPRWPHHVGGAPRRSRSGRSRSYTPPARPGPRFASTLRSLRREICETTPFGEMEKFDYRQDSNVGGGVECASSHLTIRLRRMPNFSICASTTSPGWR